MWHFFQSLYRCISSYRLHCSVCSVFIPSSPSFFDSSVSEQGNLISVQYGLFWIVAFIIFYLRILYLAPFGAYGLFVGKQKKSLQITSHKLRSHLQALILFMYAICTISTAKILLLKGFESRWYLFRNNSEQYKFTHDLLLDWKKLLMGALCYLYKNELENFVGGWFESIFVSKISTDCDFCFSQDLCPQMALHSLLWT